MGKQSQLLLQPTKVELGLRVGVEFDKIKKCSRLKNENKLKNEDELKMIIVKL